VSAKRETEKEEINKNTIVVNGSEEVFIEKLTFLWKSKKIKLAQSTKMGFFG